MMGIELHVPGLTYQQVLGHLFTARDTEYAAFLYAKATTFGDTLVLAAQDYHLVPRDGFARTSAYHFELRDDVQRRVIKEAHRLECCLVEAHSHPFPAPACFSGTDVLGLTEWVPYVRWRLAGRPYAALVAAPGSFDGLVFAAADTPVALAALVVGGIHMQPTGATIQNWEALRDS